MKKKQGATIFLLAMVLVLALARVLAPHFLLARLNTALAEFSPHFSIHIKDLDLSFFRMAYTFNTIQARQKDDTKNFLNIESLDISLAWRELIKGRLLTDIEVHFLDLNLDQGLAVFALVHHEQNKKDSAFLSEKLFPIDISRAQLHQSRVYFYQLREWEAKNAWRVTDIEATLTHFSPRPDGLPTLVVAQATLLGHAPLKLVAEVRRYEQRPPDWHVDMEFTGLELAQTNTLLRRLIPLTFESGKLDLYGQARSWQGQILGYVRVFAEDLEVIGDAFDYIGPKHFLHEILAAFGRFLLENPKQDSLATQIDFGTQEGKLKINRPKAIEMALKHRFGQALKEGVGPQLSLPPITTKSKGDPP